LRLILKIYDFLKPRRGVAVAVMLVVMGLCVLGLMRLGGDEDIASFLPQNEMSRRYSSVYERLGGQEKIAVFFRGEDAEGICAAMDRFGELLEEADTGNVVRDLQVRADEGAVLDVMDFIRENWPYFLTEDDYRRADSLLALPDFIGERLEDARRAMLYPGSAFTAENLRHDPLNLFTPVFRNLSGLNPAGNGSIVDGHIFLPDGSAGVAFLSSPYGGSESGRNAGLLRMLEGAAQEAEVEFSGVKISFTGGPVIAVENAETIKRDSIAAVTIALLLIFALLYLQFRSLRDMLWIALSILCGSLFSLGLISLFKSSISIIILGIGSIILGIAVNYPLHYVDYLKYQPDTRKALKDIIAPLTVGNLTTVLAFLSLVFMKTSALRDFGLAGALMLVGTIVFVLVFLPVLMPDGRRRSDRALKLKFGGLNVPKRLRKALAAAFLLLTVVFVFTGRLTGFDPDLHGINYMTPQQRTDLAALSELGSRHDGTEIVYAVTSAATLDSALVKNERLLGDVEGCGCLCPGCDRRECGGAVGDNVSGKSLDVSTISSVIPSRNAQKRRLALWRDFWSRHRNLTEELGEAALKAGFSSKAFSPFMQTVSRDWQPQPADYFSPLAETLCKSFILNAEPDARGKPRENPRENIGETDRATPEPAAETPEAAITLVNYIHVPSVARAELENAWNTRFSDADTFFFSASDLGTQLVSMLSEEFDYIGIVCGLIVFIFLWLSFGRLELSLLAFLPLAVSWVWILGLMGIFSIKFNIVNIILATFIFGQGDDYTIFITEGLMTEYATRRKILDSYRSSIAFSAMIMFVGIGTLIIARHPAMRSLAEVTIIGMLSVVLLAYLIPPFIFRILTTSNGQPRECPVTLRRLWNSLLAIGFFLLAVLFLVPGTKLYFLTGRSEKRRLRYHIFLQRLCRFIINHIPGVKFSWKNASGESFDRPAVIVCNHQSHLDVMFLMALSPKIVILTNDWVWNNIFYRTIIRAAEFYPVSNGLESNEKRLAELVARGYSVVVFPEGTRSADCSIGRFHRGAFELAERLGLDVLPVLIHGFGHILPKRDFMLREGEIYGEVLPRVALSAAGADLKSRTRWFRAFYLSEYERVRRERETPEYFVPYIKLQYAYKGKDIERECRVQLREMSWIYEIPMNTREYAVENCGIGAGALALALSRPWMQVYASDPDAEKLAVALNCAAVPENLHYVDAEGRELVPDSAEEMPEVNGGMEE